MNDGSPSGLRVARLGGARVAAATRFLEARVETSLFLLASLDRYGPDAAEMPTSGDFYEMTSGGRIEAVFALTRKGHLLAQTGGRRDLVPAILETCRDAQLEITGVVAEWNAAETVLMALRAAGTFAPSFVSRNLVLHRQMHFDDYEASLDHVRRLRAGDFDEWFRLYAVFMTDQGTTAPPARRDLQGHFERRSAAGWWWGAFDGPRLAGIVAADEVYRNVCQIGGLYVRPEERRRGIATALMAGLQRDCLLDAHVGRMVLFVRTDNRRAQVFYEALRFAPAGEFGLMW